MSVGPTLSSAPASTTAAAPTAVPIASLRGALGLLEAIARDRSLLDELTGEERVRFINAAGAVFSPAIEDRRQQVRARRRQEKLDKRQRDEDRLTQTGIRQARSKPVYATPNVFAPVDFSQQTVDDEVIAAGVGAEQHCYVCKQHYTDVHHFYDQLCPSCARLNFAKRTETADLSGRVALLTGGRVKIGYQAGIKLLRAGATLVVTTRFPRDAAARYASEPDFAEWGGRLEIYGLDLRHTPSIEALCHHLDRTYDRLDFIVNNACQTVRRPPEFYRHMLELEDAAVLSPAARDVLGGLDGVRRPSLIGAAVAGTPDPAATLGTVARAAGVVDPVQLSQVPLLPDDSLADGSLFPSGRLDQDLQQVDLRKRNSWRLTLSEVSSVELLETQLVNAVAPFVLNARLKPLMLRSPERDKHIVNVSAVEGMFYRRFKTTRHPHTNMAKAALNMMTRTSAAEYQADGIHMNSVDTGWVSDEDPAHLADQKRAEHRFHPPLDIVDGAARIVDPIIDGFNTGHHVWGQFLKDYRPTDW